MSRIEEFFEKSVDAGIIPQIPMNYDAVSYKIYAGYLENKIDELTAEVAELRATLSKTETVEKELREKLDKAMGLPFENLDKVFILAGEDTKAKQFIPDRIVEGTIVGFGYDVYEWVDGNYKFNYHVLVGENNYIFALEQFNKTLFKTREAAEARLKELQGGER